MAKIKTGQVWEHVNKRMSHTVKILTIFNGRCDVLVESIGGYRQSYDLHYANVVLPKYYKLIKSSKKSLINYL